MTLVILFPFSPKKKRRRKGECMYSKNCDQKPCLSARSKYCHHALSQINQALLIILNCTAGQSIIDKTKLCLSSDCNNKKNDNSPF